MSIVVLKLPYGKRKREARPKKCPYCETFQRWEQVNKPVKDVQVRNVKVYRYRCCDCKRTFRHYPEGNTNADQTERLRFLAILLWTLGLSHRASSWILSCLNVLVSFMTIWRDVQEEAQKIEKHNQWKPVRIEELGQGHKPMYWARERNNRSWIEHPCTPNCSKRRKFLQFLGLYIRHTKSTRDREPRRLRRGLCREP